MKNDLKVSAISKGLCHKLGPKIPNILILEIPYF